MVGDMHNNHGGHENMVHEIIGFPIARRWLSHHNQDHDMNALPREALYRLVPDEQPLIEQAIIELVGGCTSLLVWALNASPFNTPLTYLV